MAAMLVLGYGLGNCMQPLLLILQNAVPPRDIGVATQLGDLLPPDRRHPRRRDLPVDAVRQRRRQHQERVPGRVADPGVPAGRADGGAEPDPLDRRCAGAACTPRPVAACSPRCRTTPRSSSRCRRCSRTRSRSGSPSRWTPCSCSPACVAVLAFLVLLLMPKVELRATSASAAVARRGGAAAARRPTRRSEPVAQHHGPLGPWCRAPRVPPWTGGAGESSLRDAVERACVSGHEGKSGAGLERVRLADGRALVVKRFTPGTDLTLAVTGGTAPAGSTSCGAPACSTGCPPASATRSSTPGSRTTPPSW